MFNLTQFDNGFVSHTVTGISRETTHMEQVCYPHMSRFHTGKGWNTSLVGDKEVPSFVTVSPSGGITSQMLADLVKHLDDLGVFPRDEGPDPFIVLDGHNSRFGLPFLQYIMDPEHPWTVCVGTPYATDQCQFGDAPEMNGCFKMGLTKAKEELTCHNIASHKAVAFTPTNVIPLVNKAWAMSFGDAMKGHKALADRGWNPLNRSLLATESVLKTTSQEKEATAATGVLELNVETGIACSIIDKIVAKQDHSKARERALEKKRNADTLKENTANLRNMTSGTYVAAGEYRLNDALLLHQIACVEAKANEDNKKMEKKQSAAIFGMITKLSKQRLETSTLLPTRDWFIASRRSKGTCQFRSRKKRLWLC
jgi:hypothetical protein